MYAYLIIPFIPLFGLSDIAVRLPSALLGIVAVVSTFFLVKELLSINPKPQITNNKLKIVSSRSEKDPVGNNLLENGNLPAGRRGWKMATALLASLLLAISPWHIQFSRVAFESNIGLTCNILLVLFFVMGLRRNWVFLLSGLFAALSIYTYQSEKVFTPLLVLSLVLIFRKEIFTLPKKYLVSTVLIGALVALPMIIFTVSSEHGLARAKGTSVFSSQDDLLKYSIQKLDRDTKENNYIGYVFDNRRVEYTKLIFSGYFAHFDFNWLFITGDAERHHAPYMGLLYIWELPFILIGIYAAIFSPWMRRYRKLQLVIFTWFLLAPVPAAITNDVPHAVRTLNFLPTFQVFIAIGILQTIQFVKQYLVLGIRYKVLSYILYSLVFILITGNSVYFLNQYFVQQNNFYSKHWQYGYKEAVAYAVDHQDKYEKILVSDKVPLDQSYIFFLYHMKFPPQEYQNTQGVNHSFSKFEFKAIDWKADSTRSNTLLIGSPGEFPEVIPADHMINYLDGQPAIKIVSTD